MSDKLSGIKAGDRVRVTFEGEVDFCGGGSAHVKVDGGGRFSSSFSPDDTKSPHFHIERIEKPLAVGDRVKDAAFGFGEGEILCVDEGSAFIRWNDMRYPASALLLSNLERIS